MGSGSSDTHTSAYFIAKQYFKGQKTDKNYLSEQLIETEQIQGQQQTLKEAFNVKKKNVKQYYETQQEILDKWNEFQKILQNPSQLQDADKGNWLIWLSMAFNMAFFLMMVVLAVRTLLFSIIAVTLDSVMDFLSGLVLFQGHRLSLQQDIHKYPLGKSRFELLGIIIFASILAALQLTVILESVQSIIVGRAPTYGEPLSYLVAVLLIVIGGNTFLFIACQLSKNDSVQAYAQDHRNDAITSSFSLLFVLLSNKINSLWDPIGAILISSCMVYNWLDTALEYAEFFTGSSAPPKLLQILTMVTFYHNSKIVKINSVNAFLFGKRYFAEIHVVLQADVALQERHNIRESLQKSLELVPEVDRAYVHLDYEQKYDTIFENKSNGQMQQQNNQTKYEPIMQNNSQQATQPLSNAQTSQNQPQPQRNDKKLDEIKVINI